MEPINKEEAIKKEKKNPYLIISSFLFFVVVWWTIALWFVNNNLSKQIDENNSLISGYSKQINELRANSAILSYDIVYDNKTEIQNIIQKSAVQRHIDNVINMAKKYSVVMNWFSFDWEKITTSATIDNADGKLNTMKVASNFIMDFRTAKDLAYTLAPISTVWWNNSKRTFDVILTVK